MNITKHHFGRQLATLALLVLALVRFQPVASDAAQQLTHPYRWVDQVGPDRAIAEFAAGLLWLTSAWLVIALLAASWIERTGRSSRLLRTVARSMPRSLQRLVFTGVGISLLAGPAVASASTPSGVTTPGTLATTPSTIAAPQWPTMTQASTAPTADPPPSSAPAPGIVPAPQWPTEMARPTPTTTQPSTIAGPTLPTNATSPRDTPTNAPTTTPEPTNPVPTTPALPTSTNATESATPAPADPTLNAPKPPPIEKSPTNKGETVVVRPGDSLWTITAQQLGPTASDADIAVEWPYWYRTNHRVIGDDPGILHPGQRLVVPSQKG